jgi:hypothetical protein
MDKSINFYIKVPFDNSLIYVMKNTEERASFDTYEEALQAAIIWKAYEIVQECYDN